MGLATLEFHCRSIINVNSPHFMVLKMYMLYSYKLCKIPLVCLGWSYFVYRCPAIVILCLSMVQLPENGLKIKWTYCFVCLFLMKAVFQLAPDLIKDCIWVNHMVLPSLWFFLWDNWVKFCLRCDPCKLHDKPHSHLFPRTRAVPGDMPVNSTKCTTVGI